MFPVGDDEVPGAGPAFVLWGLVLINTLVFLYEATLPENQLEAFITAFGVIPREILAGVDLLTLVTSMFLHGGWMHLIGNMLFLWVFGDNIEAVLGRLGFLAFYMVGGFAASAAHIFFNPASNIPSVGASGAIAAVLGAYIVMFPQSRVRLLLLTGYGTTIARTTALAFLGIWAVTQLLNGIASLGVATAQTSGVAFWAHIGGFAFGALVGLALRGRARRIPLTA